jgi:hypothetical protein
VSVHHDNDKTLHLGPRTPRSDDRLLEAVSRLIHDAYAGRPQLAYPSAQSVVMTASVLSTPGKNAGARTS